MWKSQNKLNKESLVTATISLISEKESVLLEWASIGINLHIVNTLELATISWVPIIYSQEIKSFGSYGVNYVDKIS